MSIRDRETNKRYTAVLLCAENAPEGTFEQAKQVTEIIGEIADGALDYFRAKGIAFSNGDGIRNVEVSIFKELIASQPEPDTFLADAIGWGTLYDAGDTHSRCAMIDRLKYEQMFVTLRQEFDPETAKDMVATFELYRAAGLSFADAKERALRVGEDTRVGLAEAALMQAGLNPGDYDIGVEEERS